MQIQLASRAPFLPIALASALSVLAPGCKSNEAEKSDAMPRMESAEVSDQATVQATVVSIDRPARLLTLQRADGTTFVVVAGPQVGNFAQVEVGDVLRVRYLASLAVRLLAAGETPQDGAMLAAGAAAPGQKPAGGVGVRADVTVRIESVDLQHDLVVFTPPDGMLRTVRVVRPEGKAFIQKLKPGDQVVITYTEALAVSIEE